MEDSIEQLKEDFFQFMMEGLKENFNNRAKNLEKKISDDPFSFEKVKKFINNNTKLPITLLNTKKAYIKNSPPNTKFN